MATLLLINSLELPPLCQHVININLYDPTLSISCLNLDLPTPSSLFSFVECMEVHLRRLFSCCSGQSNSLSLQNPETGVFYNPNQRKGNIWTGLRRTGSKCVLFLWQSLGALWSRLASLLNMLPSAEQMMAAGLNVFVCYFVSLL